MCDIHKPSANDMSFSFAGWDISKIFGNTSRKRKSNQYFKKLMKTMQLYQSQRDCNLDLCAVCCPHCCLPRWSLPLKQNPPSKTFMSIFPFLNTSFPVREFEIWIYAMVTWYLDLVFTFGNNTSPSERRNSELNPSLSQKDASVSWWRDDQLRI